MNVSSPMITTQKICKLNRLDQYAKTPTSAKNFVFFSFCIENKIPSLNSNFPLPPPILPPLDVRAPSYGIRVPFHVIPLLPPPLSVGFLPCLFFLNTFFFYSLSNFSLTHNVVHYDSCTVQPIHMYSTLNIVICILEIHYEKSLKTYMI